MCRRETCWRVHVTNNGFKRQLIVSKTEMRTGNKQTGNGCVCVD